MVLVREELEYNKKKKKLSLSEEAEKGENKKGRRKKGLLFKDAPSPF